MKPEEQFFINTLFEVEDLIHQKCVLELHDNTSMSDQYSKAIDALNNGLIKMYAKALQDSTEVHIKNLTPKETQYLAEDLRTLTEALAHTK